MLLTPVTIAFILAIQIRLFPAGVSVSSWFHAPLGCRVVFGPVSHLVRVLVRFSIFSFLVLPIQRTIGSLFASLFASHAVCAPRAPRRRFHVTQPIWDPPLWIGTAEGTDPNPNPNRKEHEPPIHPAGPGNPGGVRPLRELERWGREESKDLVPSGSRVDCTWRPRHAMEKSGERPDKIPASSSCYP